MKTTVLLVALVLAFGMTASAESIVKNGGFESGDFTDWDQFGDTEYSAVTNGYCPGVPTNTGCMPNSGAWALFLSEGAGSVGISQTLTTVPGDNYTLHFAYEVDPGGNGTDPASYSFSWGGEVFASETNPAQVGWTPFTKTFVATGDSTVLQFSTSDIPDWIGIDDISVTDDTPTPEPGSIALSAFGLLLAAAARKRFFAPRG